MSKMKLGVAIHSMETIVLGVTSIMPNLGGILIQTENGNNLQVGNEEYYIHLVLDYDDGIPEVDEDWKVIDGRNL